MPNLYLPPCRDICFDHFLKYFLTYFWDRFKYFWSLIKIIWNHYDHDFLIRFANFPLPNFIFGPDDRLQHGKPALTLLIFANQVFQFRWHQRFLMFLHSWSVLSAVIILNKSIKQILFNNFNSISEAPLESQVSTFS